MMAMMVMMMIMMMVMMAMMMMIMMITTSRLCKQPQALIASGRDPRDLDIALGAENQAHAHPQG